MFPALQPKPQHNTCIDTMVWYDMASPANAWFGKVLVLALVLESIVRFLVVFFFLLDLHNHLSYQLLAILAKLTTNTTLLLLHRREGSILILRPYLILRIKVMVLDGVFVWC